jgi:hypothetical protein
MVDGIVMNEQGHEYFDLSSFKPKVEVVEGIILTMLMIK